MSDDLETQREVQQCLDQGRPRDALVILQKAIGARGLTVDYCLLLARIFELLGRVGRAIEVLEGAGEHLRSDPRVAALLLRLRQPN